MVHIESIKMNVFQQFEKIVYLFICTAFPLQLKKDFTTQTDLFNILKLFKVTYVCKFIIHRLQSHQNQ